MKRRIWLLALTLSACGHSDPTQTWTLDPLPPPDRPAVRSVAPVQITAVHVPLELDRLELVEEEGGNRVTVRDFDRWGAPLGDLLRRTLGADLAARLPAATVIPANAPAPPATRALVVDVVGLRPTSDGYLLDARWTLLPPGSRVPLRSGQVALTVPRTGTGAAGQVDATTRLVAALADRIAPAL